MKKLAEEAHFNFPYFFDDSQEVAHAYQAACTPDFYLFDADLKLFIEVVTITQDRVIRFAPLQEKIYMTPVDKMLQGKPQLKGTVSKYGM